MTISLMVAEKRIVKHRMKDAVVRVKNKEGNELSDVELTVEQFCHDFKFGSNIFNWKDEETEWQKEYRQKFAALLNYATLPFYWTSFEPERGEPRYEYMDKVSTWCAENGIDCKGHPLAWNNAAPKWLPNDLDEIRRLSDERVREIVSRYKVKRAALPVGKRAALPVGKIEIWDVVNEATDPWRFDNFITDTWEKYGQIPFTTSAFEIAREANPDATLLINDYRTDPDYADVIKQLQDETGERLYNVIGIQSHMHGGVWDTEKIWKVCERFAEFGVPLHFTETTIVSGPKTESGWGETTPELEAKQADEVERFYTVLFSHPAVEAITWWDFSDFHAWQGAAAGFLRKDMSPKPVYERLMELIKNKWWTNVAGRTNRDGKFKFKGFFGKYKITAKDQGGNVVSKRVHLTKDEVGKFELVVSK